MDEDASAHQRRRRRRRPGDAPPVPGPGIAPHPPQPAAAADSGPDHPTDRRTENKPRRQRPAHDGGERGLRDLVGAGHSQVGVSGALRARDLNRPTDEDLAEAEEALVIVRRNWQPPDARK